MIAEHVEYTNLGIMRIGVMHVHNLHSVSLITINPIVDTVEKYMAVVVRIVLSINGA